MKSALASTDANFGKCDECYTTLGYILVSDNTC